MGYYATLAFIKSVLFEPKLNKNRSVIAIPDIFLKTILFAPKYIFSILFENEIF